MSDYLSISPAPRVWQGEVLHLQLRLTAAGGATYMPNSGDDCLLYILQAGEIYARAAWPARPDFLPIGLAANHLHLQFPPELTAELLPGMLTVEVSLRRADTGAIIKQAYEIAEIQYSHTRHD